MVMRHITNKDNKVENNVDSRQRCQQIRKKIRKTKDSGGQREEQRGGKPLEENTQTPGGQRQENKTIYMRKKSLAKAKEDSADAEENSNAVMNKENQGETEEI